MRVRRVAGILLVAGAIGGAVAGFRGMGRTVEKSASELTAHAGGGKVTNPARAEPGDRARGDHALTLPGTPERAWEATEEENAVVAELIELRQMAEGTGLELAPEQWVALAAVTRRTQLVRSRVEAEIGAVEAVAPGRWRMDVPGYAAAGAAMRARFFGEIGEALGAGVAAEVIDRLGPALEGYFAGFGVSLQTLDIAADPRGAAGDWQVTRTVAYSKNAMGGDQVAVRRETYFAQREDPVVERLRS